MAKVKFRLTYADKSSYTFNRLKASAGDPEILDTASAISRLRAGTANNIIKVVETEIQDA